jgi:hypothetical protein
MLVDIIQFHLMQVRTSYSCWMKFRLTKNEVRALIAFYGYLRFLNSSIASRDKFLDTISGNYRERIKFSGYLRGLSEKGIIGSYEYVSAPDTVSIGLTDYGYSAIVEWQRSVEDHLERFKSDPRRLPGVGSDQNINRYRRLS